MHILSTMPCEGCEESKTCPAIRVCEILMKWLIEVKKTRTEKDVLVYNEKAKTLSYNGTELELKF